jgi:hypothetical protein
MLTVVDSNGVPSVAKMVSVGTSLAAPSSPTVALTAPANDASFTAPATVELAATAADPDGIAKVDFFTGTTLLGTDTTAPYTYTWTGVQSGSHSLTARATDIPGSSATTAATTITVRAAATNAAPTASITAPSPGATVPRKADLVIAAAASDSDGTVAKVEFFRADGGAKLGEDTTAPFSYTWRKPSSGDHLLRVRATDDAGALSPLSASVRVTVQR